MKMIPFEIPSNWTWTTLGEIADVVGGGTPRTNDPENYEGGTIPWITPADLSGYTAKNISHGDRFITTKGLAGSSAKMMPSGTVLFSSRAPVGYVAIAANPVCTNQGFKSFVLKTKDILPDYLYWWLKGSKELAESLASGTTFLELSGAKAKQLPIPLAPPGQQQSIVEEIEKQFSRLDEAVANLKRVKANLKRYKAAVLKAAVEGKLTEGWRKAYPDIEPASKLLDRILAERRTKWKGRGKYKEPRLADTSDLPDLPNGWIWARWEQIGFSQNGRAFPSSQYQQSGVKLLRPGNLHVSGKVIWTEENTRFMPRKWAEKFPEFLVGPHELIMNLTAQSLKDEFLGRVCLTGHREFTLLNQRQAKLTPILIGQNFLLWLFKSSIFRRFVDGLNTGSLIQHMFTSQLADFVLPLPPLDEQQQIVSEVEHRLSVIDELESTVESNLTRANRLRQTILQNAFTGRLAPHGFHKPTHFPSGSNSKGSTTVIQAWESTKMTQHF